MNAKLPLPAHLHQQSFSTAELTAAGMGIQRTKAEDLQRFAHGMYRPADTPPSAWSSLGRDNPAHGLTPDDLRALLRHHHQATLSHLSAAHLFGIPLPAWTDSARSTLRHSGHAVHLTTQDGQRIRRRDIGEHRRRLSVADIVYLFGIRTTTAARTWLDLASMAPLMDRDALVIAGDFLVNHPWLTGVGRTDPLTTVSEIRQTMQRTGRFVGISAAREALELVRVGADSPPETSLRLAFVDSGLPEPELQVSADPSDPWAPQADLGLVQWKIALQYEGAHHRDRKQQEIDARRDAWFQTHGWLVIKVTGEDMRHGFRRVLDLVRERILSFDA